MPPPPRSDFMPPAQLGTTEDHTSDFHHVFFDFTHKKGLKTGIRASPRIFSSFPRIQLPKSLKAAISNLKPRKFWVRKLPEKRSEISNFLVNFTLRGVFQTILSINTNISYKNSLKIRGQLHIWGINTFCSIRGICKQNQRYKNLYMTLKCNQTLTSPSQPAYLVVFFF